MANLAAPVMHAALPHHWQESGRRLAGLLPGVLLCGAVAGAAMLLERLEAGVLGRAWLEALVLAILVGTILRSLWSPAQIWLAGIRFSAKTLLEIAVLLLGASVSAQAIAAAGPALLIGIVGVVLVAICASYGIGRLLGLPHKMAILVACGNSICGNSAIAAVAPVIGADGRDVAASIGFTAVLGVLVVLGLPLLAPLVDLRGAGYGVLAGLTVYAVPQVLAATAPMGALAMQVGTLVKLVRVLMLGPVVLFLSLLTPRRDAGRLKLHRLVPWFILGFLLLSALRSFALLPGAILPPVAVATNLLTVIAMAALGLSTDLRVVSRSGARVAVTVTLSLLVLGVISLGLIRLLGIA
jgi:uncharacterized integral membrane protein (TIGR00698 family)